MVAALLYYKKFVKSLKSKAFKLNPYDGCVANKIVKGKQITICFHVDDCKISHEVPQVIDETNDWEKLRHLIEYLRKDNIRPLVLGADNDGLLMWYVDQHPLNRN